MSRPGETRNPRSLGRSEDVNKRVLFVSNGHGEDLNASSVLQAWRSLDPSISFSALPIVGEGKAYRKLGVPLIGPTRTLPSGGFVYMSNQRLWYDLRAGLLGLLWQQVRALQEHSHTCDFVFATGDVVVMVAALLSGCPFGLFLVSSSSFYEGKMQLPWLAQGCVRHPRCRVIFTRDRFSAEQLQAQGISRAVFAGYPIMDVLRPTGQNLGLKPDIPMIALLPGSRMPEAAANLKLQLHLVLILAQSMAQPCQFCAALVPELGQSLSDPPIGWCERSPGILVHNETQTMVRCFTQSFAEILQKCTLAVGMAGTAVEQAVGLGKPVIQIPGEGPQFTYRFAEAQNRLLGLSVRTIGTEPANESILQQAAQEIVRVLGDRQYQKQCVLNGQERVGSPGGALGIAQRLALDLRV